MWAQWGGSSLAMQRYCAGDAEAFVDVYVQVAPRLRAHFMRTVCDRSLVEDLLQDTFLRLHETRGRFAPGAPIAPWIFTIAHRLLLDHLRRAKIEASVLSTGLAQRSEDGGQTRSAEELLHAKRLTARLGQEISLLPVSQREAFELVRRQGLTIAETSCALGVSAVAVRLRVHRAGRTLKHRLDLTTARRACSHASQSLEARSARA